MTDKYLYIIAGCNGAGKTAASFTILPEILECREFVNADEIAKGISPFQPEKVALDAGRIMLNRVNELLNGEDSFAFETTLSTRSYRQKIKEAKKKGFTITLIFFWLNNVELAKERVKMRVSEGGHNIENEVIERRYIKGIKNLFDIYLPIVDYAFLIDNSFEDGEMIAKKTINSDLEIIQNDKFHQLKLFMATIDKQQELEKKIILGLKKTRENVIEFKRQKNTMLVVMKGDEIVKIAPWKK